MTDAIGNRTLREVTPLRADETVGQASRRIVEEELPALPVIEEDGSFAGIFGEREFLAALFPGWIGELGSSAMISRTIDDTIERREGCREEPIRKYLTTDHVLVDDDYSDTQLAELFLHHRVLIIPIATQGQVHALVTRGDFFRELVGRLAESPSGSDGG